MSNYYNMRDGKARIAQELLNRGWEVQGYRASYMDDDMGSDYPYHAAHWEGIATKNGFILVVDIDNDAEAKEIKQYNPKGNLSFDDREKITKLEQMTIERGATAGEEQNAKALIEKIKSKVTGVSSYEVVGMTLAHLGNPKGSKWHIEKDGKIYDKGTGITKYADIPESKEFDINKMEYTERYKKVWTGDDENGCRIMEDRKLPDETRKIINDFKSLILRFERVVNGMNSCGDGTKETESAGLDQQGKAGYEKVTITENKTGLRMVEVTDRKYIKVGDYLTLRHHGGFWLVTDAGQRTGTWKINGVATKLTKNTFDYEQIGAESRGYKRTKNAKGYYQWEDSLLKDIENGNVKIFELKEVTEAVEVEKWVKIDKSKKVYNTTKKVEQEETEKENVTEQHEQTNDNIDIDNIVIITDEEPATSKQLWALHCATKLNTKDLKISKSKASELIRRSKAGENITIIVNKLINGDVTEQQKEEQPKNNKSQDTADSIEDYSTDIITELGLKPNEYITNLQYKSMLVDKLKNCNFTITADVINCIEYEGLKQVLQKILTDTEEQKQQEKYKTEKTALLEKIENNITSLQTKIDALSGDYKVNTWKRQNEQASRDNKKESYTIDIKILEHIQTKLLNNEQITALEKSLTVGAFRTLIHSYYNTKYGKYPRDVKFPCYDYSLPSDGWWNKEVPQMQNKLRKYCITDTKQLFQAVEEYKVIYTNCCKYESPIEQKIKKLTNEYKMQQKGDIHFTTNKELLNQLMDLAEVTESDAVLEPSAGIGCIADEIKKYTKNIDCCEYYISYAELLKIKGYKVTANDFLTYEKYNHYDKIIANVPFSDEQNHVKHIYKCLKADGRAVIITSNHWTFANDRNSQDFREWLNNLTYEVYDAPAKSFEFTNVTAKILVIYKDTNDLQMAM